MPSVVIRRKNGLKILKENDKKRIKKLKWDINSYKYKYTKNVPGL